MFVCIHTYIHTCIHTYMHTYIHAYVHIHMHTYIHSPYTITDTHVNVYAYTRAMGWLWLVGSI